MNSTMMASITNGQFMKVPTISTDDVVELSLLLPSHRAAELVQLAKDRHESVGQLLRKLIDRELTRSA